MSLKALMRPASGMCGPAAEVDELALPVEAQGGVVGETSGNVLGLEFLVEIADELHRFVARENEPLERFRLLDDGLHLGLDAGEVLLADRLLQVEVVIEPVAGGRSEREPHSLIQPHHGPGHHVRRRNAAGRRAIRSRGW